jgi:hypothetical protein
MSEMVRFDIASWQSARKSDRAPAKSLALLLNLEEESVRAIILATRPVREGMTVDLNRRGALYPGWRGALGPRGVAARRAARRPGTHQN